MDELDPLHKVELAMLRAEHQKQYQTMIAYVKEKVGAGVEYSISPHWSAKGEYNFLGLSDRTVSGFGNTATLDRDIQMLKVGVNYLFNGSRGY